MASKDQQDSPQGKPKEKSEKEKLEAGKFEIPKEASIDAEFDIKSLEYDIFTNEESLNTLPKTLYEKISRISEKLIPVEPDKKAKQRMEEAIEFAHISVTPRGVVSITFLSGILLLALGVFLFVLKYLNITAMIIYLCASAGLVYYIYTYPFRLKKIYELKVGSEIVMMVLHMVIYLKDYPNLEGAVKFSASNITGPLALDLKKLIWDVHIGTYDSMEQGLLAFSQKWKGSFRPFADSVNAMVYSLYSSGNRRTELLDESVKIILDSLSERSTTYVTQLKSPITLVNALGILLPIMVLTMLPILTIFLPGEIPPSVIFGGYDILLPMILLFIIKNILDQRVVTLPEPDLSLHPNMPPANKFSFRGDKYLFGNSCNFDPGSISLYWFLELELHQCPFGGRHKNSLHHAGKDSHEQSGNNRPRALCFIHIHLWAFPFDFSLFPFELVPEDKVPKRNSRDGG